MSDTVLLITGIAVFGLMLIAVLLTIFEFNTIYEGRRQRRAVSVKADGREILRKEPD
jgi:hypothetical protein